MAVPVLTAVTGAEWEADLVAALDRAPFGVTVVRRCVDLADLLAAAASGTARAVLVSADLRRLDREALSRLSACGVAVVGLVTPGDEDGERRLRQLGLGVVVNADAGAERISAAVLDALRTTRDGRPESVRERNEDAVEDGTEYDETEYDATEYGESGAGKPSVEPEAGRLIAVWGPTGAPGRTTVAVNVAAELAALHLPTLLVDADTYGGVVAQVLGLLDEAPGIAAAARLANTGSLDLPALARLARQVNGTALRVLTGIARPDRWPELRPSSLEVVWRVARTLAAFTVVDCAFSLERDEEIAFDTAAPRRNGATLTTLEAADAVLVIGAADPIGVQRLVRGLTDLHETVPGLHARIVLNRVRRGPVGADPERQLAAALDRFAGVDDVCFVPEDRTACDRALAAGRTLREMAPDSPARKALALLAEQLAGELSGELARHSGGRLVPAKRRRPWRRTRAAR
jgi:MinD-like ATPase involved in chromosome partitioning or flagellar assembly